MTTDLTTDLTATAVLRLLGRRPRVLALGEPTHGAEGLLAARNDLFRQLVEDHGYRTIAIEIDCLMADVADAYVTTGAGTLDTAMTEGFSHEWGAFPGNRDLVRRLRAHNEHRPPAEQVRLAGFDGPLEIHAAASPRAALLALHAAVAGRTRVDAAELDRLLGADERWTNPEVMYDPAKSIGRSPEAERLAELTAELVALLEPGDGELALKYGRTAAGLLRYHRSMGDPTPDRMAGLLGTRAGMMAENLLALAERGPVLVSAHNSHLQRATSSMNMGGHIAQWRSTGALVADHLGHDYAVLATAIGTLRDHDIDAPPPDTLEGLLHAQPQDRSLADPAALAALAPAARVSPWFGYAPLNPAELSGADGVVFVRVP